MSPSSSRDRYLDPDTGVLRNRFAIRDQEELDSTEAALVAVRCYELLVEPLDGAYDLAHLQAIHRYLFGDLYEWAGQLRTVDIFKGHAFAHHGCLESAARPIFAALGSERYLVGLAAGAFSARVAHYLAEINALHPFRDGNGRSQRMFFSQLAADGGYYIAWEGMTQAQMVAASIQAFEGTSEHLAKLIRANLSRS
jgi:cell filamentation protein